MTTRAADAAGVRLVSVAMFSVAGVTFANGGDKIGVEVSLFARLTYHGGIVVVFLVMVGVLCALSGQLVNHSVVSAPIRRLWHRMTPFALIALGMALLPTG